MPAHPADTPLTRALASRFLDSVPRVLGLLDKNPLSRTYGCLDRKYWQYKIVDFSSGMQQELSRVLAYAWAAPLPGNPWRGNARLREYALAAIGFFARSLHRDGSLDDYFPWERALGATAYAAAAVTDACSLLGYTPEGPVRQALIRVGGFLAAHREMGLLSNHHAIAACALLGIAAHTGETAFVESAKSKIAVLASVQHADGWFPEYEGCDIGYQTVTLEFLARCAQAAPELVPPDMLTRLTGFLRAFAHPDGSLGGEYGSRNTYNFYPGGFALLSTRSDAAAEMLGLHLRGLERGTANVLDDDGCFGHLLSSSVTVLTAPALRVLTPAFEPTAQPWLRVYPDCGLFLGGAGALRLYGNLTKGGCFKIFQEERLLCSDTGFAGELADGTLFCQNNPGCSKGAAEGAMVRITGTMRRLRNKRLTQASMLALRLLCFVFGGFSGFSRAIRRTMQAMLIYDRSTVPVNFSREIRLDDQCIEVKDVLSSSNIARLFLTPDCVNIHVITSDSFQQANLLPWQPLSTPKDREFSLSRRFPPA